MAKEIERKFLVRNTDYRKAATCERHLRQAYLSLDPRATVRVRVADGRGFLTVKGLNSGAVRNEWEYEIPVGDAEEMLAECAVSTVIDKRRLIVPAGNGLQWEIDEFGGAHAGLTVAEIELPDASSPLPPAPFIRREVTGDVRYYKTSHAAAEATTPPCV